MHNRSHIHPQCGITSPPSRGVIAIARGVYTQNATQQIALKQREFSFRKAHPLAGLRRTSPPPSKRWRRSERVLQSAAGAVAVVETIPALVEDTRDIFIAYLQDGTRVRIHALQSWAPAIVCTPNSYSERVVQALSKPHDPHSG